MERKVKIEEISKRYQLSKQKKALFKALFFV
jgi:hypothetical protein